MARRLGQFTPRWPRLHQLLCLGCLTNRAWARRWSFATYLPCYVVRERAAGALVDLLDLVPAGEVEALADAQPNGSLTLPAVVADVIARFGAEPPAPGIDITPDSASDPEIARLDGADRAPIAP